MKCDIIIAGVGGQGILSIANVLGRAAVEAGLHVKQAEVHGMAQRGGAVQSHFRMSEDPIFSEIIPHAGAQVVVAMEPMESLRYSAWLSPEGWLVTNTEAFENIEYPPLDEVHAAVRQWARHLLFDGTAIAREAGSTRTLNMVMLGAASPFIPLSPEVLEKAVAEQFAAKGDKLVEANLKAFRMAREVAQARKQEMA